MPSRDDPSDGQPRYMGKGAVFLVIGPLMLVGAIVSYVNASSFVSASVETKGRVVDFRKAYAHNGVRSGRGSTVYAPVIRFRDKIGHRIEFTAQTYRKTPAFTRGQIVNVLYVPGNPHNAKLDSTSTVWGLPVALGIMGIGLFVVGLVMTQGRRRPDSIEEEM